MGRVSPHPKNFRRPQNKGKNLRTIVGCCENKWPIVFARRFHGGGQMMMRGVSDDDTDAEESGDVRVLLKVPTRTTEYDYQMKAMKGL
ncbi:hypothetical protein HAX54_012561 [Datura stramonium]|uniref:Uncharacterized protein n=1 Tax=Datura stramonium TaxID=4076 RepID=A0ABS8TJY1_DATST|nr:hypothetical protein [Datura stramonium]